MTFIQTIAFSSGRIEDMQAMMDEWGESQRALGDQVPGFLGTKLLKDRERENAFMVVAEFESYELAMQNSERPETDAFAKRMADLTDGPPLFGNYDVIAQDMP